MRELKFMTSRDALSDKLAFLKYSNQIENYEVTHVSLVHDLIKIQTNGNSCLPGGEIPLLFGLIENMEISQDDILRQLGITPFVPFTMIMEQPPSINFFNICKVYLKGLVDVENFTYNQETKLFTLIMLGGYPFSIDPIQLNDYRNVMGKYIGMKIYSFDNRCIFIEDLVKSSKGFYYCSENADIEVIDSKYEQLKKVRLLRVENVDITISEMLNAFRLYYSYSKEKRLAYVLQQKGFDENFIKKSYNAIARNGSLPIMFIPKKDTMNMNEFQCTFMTSFYGACNSTRSVHPHFGNVEFIQNENGHDGVTFKCPNWGFYNEVLSFMKDVDISIKVVEDENTAFYIRHVLSKKNIHSFYIKDQFSDMYFVCNDSKSSAYSRVSKDGVEKLTNIYREKWLKILNGENSDFINNCDLVTLVNLYITPKGKLHTRKYGMTNKINDETMLPQDFPLCFPSCGYTSNGNMKGIFHNPFTYLEVSLPENNVTMKVSTFRSYNKMFRPNSLERIMDVINEEEDEDDHYFVSEYTYYSEDGTLILSAKFNEEQAKLVLESIKKCMAKGRWISEWTRATIINEGVSKKIIYDFPPLFNSPHNFPNRSELIYNHCCR